MPVSCQLSFCDNRVFERRETVGENTYPVAGAQRDARVGRADKDRVAGIEGGEFAQGAQQLRGITLQIAGMPAIRLAAVDFGDDGQIVDVAYRR